MVITQKRSAGARKPYASRFFIRVTDAPTIKRRKKIEKLNQQSYLCMLLLAVVVIAGLTLETVKLIEIGVLRRQTLAAKNEYRMLEGKTDSLMTQIELNCDVDRVMKLADQKFGMRLPEEGETRLLAIEYGESSANGQTVYAYRK